MVLLTIFPYSGPLWSRPVPGRSPNARLGSEAQSAAICRSWPLPAANMLNKATRTVNSVPWQRVGARAADTLQGQRGEEGDSVISRPVSPPSVGRQIEGIFHPFCLCNTRTQMQTRIIRIHGEHPRLQWVTPGYTNSPSPLFLSLSLSLSHCSPVPTPAASGTYWRQSHTEP